VCKIPTQFIPAFNELLAAARDWDVDDMAELARIKTLQSSYTKAVEGKSPLPHLLLTTLTSA
jgi:hypothetical protein